MGNKTYKNHKGDILYTALSLDELIALEDEYTANLSTSNYYDKSVYNKEWNDYMSEWSDGYDA